MDSPLSSTVNEVLPESFKFRILVVGKSGCGKSALLSKVFGVDPNPENGELAEKLEYNLFPTIQGGLIFRENSKFILYISSPDFLPNSDTDFDEITDFLRTRLNSEDPQQTLHAIWVCMDTPLGGERLSESGIERVLNEAHRRIPIIIVLTKFDLLVNSITNTEKTPDSRSDEEISEDRETAECLLDDTLKKVSLDSLLSQQLVTPVSTMHGYEDTISTLIQSTDGVIQRFKGKRTHDSPIALAWAIAQRQDLETTVAAIIDVGGKRHWSGLGSIPEFRGKTLEQCVSVIHEDVIAIWNIEDISNYLGGKDFKARMSHLVEDLVYTSQDDPSVKSPISTCAAITFVAATANPIIAIGAVAEAAKWVSDVYQVTPSSIACIMGYIVDLIMILTFFSEIHQISETVLRRIEEDAVNAIKAFISSELLSEIHKEIRNFVMADKWRETTDEGDFVLREIVRLISKFHPRARGSAKKASQKLPSPTISVTILDESSSQYTQGECVLSHLPSVKPRIVPRRGAHEAPSDILTIVEEATKTPTPRSSFEGAQRPALLIPETIPAESSKFSPLNLLSWIRREHPGTDEEAGEA